MKTTDHKKSGISERDVIIGSAISAALAGSSLATACATPQQLAALMAGTVTEAERELLFGHMAECDRCREVYLLTHELSTTEPVRQSNRSWYMAGGALAMAALLVLAVKLPLTPEPHIRTATHTETAPAVQIAQAPTMPPTPAPQAANPRAPMAKKTAAPILNLITPEEAAQPGSRSYGFAGVRSDGPEIHIQAPNEVTGDEPIPDITISYAPRDGNLPYLTSFRLEYRKQNPLDLTLRVAPFVSGSGVKLKQVRLPEGLHHFRVSIADMRGRISEKDFTIMVSGRF